MKSTKVSTTSENQKPATSSRSEVRMLTPSELESLRRDKAESGQKALEYFRAQRLAKEANSRK